MIGYYSIANPDFPSVLRALSDKTIREEIKEKLESLAIAKRLSDDHLEAIYSIAHGIYIQGKFEQASKMFQMLVFFKPFEDRFILALGLCNKKLLNFDDAVGCFTALVVLMPFNFLYSLHLAECFVAQNKINQSLDLLESIIVASKNTQEFDVVHKRAMALREHLLSRAENI